MYVIIVALVIIAVLIVIVLLLLKKLQFGSGTDTQYYMYNVLLYFFKK